MAQTGKNLPAVQGTWVLSLGWEKTPWRGKWLPTPVFLPGKYPGQRSLVGCCLCGRKQLHVTEQLTYLPGPRRPVAPPGEMETRPWKSGGGEYCDLGVSTGEAGDCHPTWVSGEA